MSKIEEIELAIAQLSEPQKLELSIWLSRNLALVSKNNLRPRVGEAPRSNVSYSSDVFEPLSDLELKEEGFDPQ